MEFSRQEYWSGGEELDGAETAAAAAKSLQSCPTLCDPIDGSPPGSPIPGILQAADSYLQYMGSSSLTRDQTWVLCIGDSEV